MQKSNLRFGVVGVGRIGKIHIENLANRIRGAEVAADSIDHLRRYVELLFAGAAVMKGTR